MRTLVVSDLHVGAQHGRCALDEEVVAARLTAALAGVDRLVLLGDVIELRQRPMRDALAAASRVLPGLVAGLSADAEVVMVVGNHDHELFAGWFTRRGASAPAPPLGLEAAVDWADGESLAAVMALLSSSGASVRAAYPGLWLREDVYATHGHYLDRHTTAPGFERLGVGAMSRYLKLADDQLRTPDEYERILAPIYAWMLAISERGGPELDSAGGGGSQRVLRILQEGGLKGRSLQLGVNVLAKLLQLAGLGELSGEVFGPALHRTEVRGFGTVMSNLAVTAPYVIFGHIHRAGPLADDDPALWTTPLGSRLFNSGCWVRESPAFLPAAEAATSAYRAGFALELDDQGPPRLVNLLDG